MTLQQINSFCEALLSAFPTPADLDRMVFLKLGKALSALVAPGPLDVMVTALIRDADGRGESEKLLHAAHEDRPQNPKLRDFYWSYFGAPADAPAAQAGKSPGPEAPTAEPGRLRLVYCHAPKDAVFGAALERHLTSLVKKSHIERPWSEAMIRAGQVRHREIEAAWNAADLIVLLISADFLFAHDDDLQRAERRRREGATIIPVIVRPVAWQDSPIGELHVYPRAEDQAVKPVSKWSDPEDAWLSVREGILAVINARRESSQER